MKLHKKNVLEVLNLIVDLACKFSVCFLCILRKWIIKNLTKIKDIYNSKEDIFVCGVTAAVSNQSMISSERKQRIRKIENTKDRYLPSSDDRRCRQTMYNSGEEVNCESQDASVLSVFLCSCLVIGWWYQAAVGLGVLINWAAWRMYTEAESTGKQTALQGKC